MDAQQRRHQYLSALGVTSWLPRAELPGAAPSADWVAGFLYGDFADTDGQVADLDDNIDDAKVLSPTVAPVTPASLKLDVPRAVDVPKTPTTPAVLVDEPAVTERVRPVRSKAPRFRLAFWHFGDVLVVDSLPPAGRDQALVQRQGKLCFHLLKALGFDVPAQVTPYTLAWPMLAGEQLDQGPDQAQLAVAHKLRKLQAEQPCRWVLMLGEAAAQMVMARDESLEQLKGMRFSLSTQTYAIASLSLTQMLQIPECKQDVWVDLQQVWQR